MRLCFVMYCPEDRARTSICFWLGRELVKRGHEVTLIALSLSRRFRAEWRVEDGVRLLLTPFGVTGRWHHGVLGPHDIATRVVHLLREQYDVLVAYDFP